MNYLVRYMDHSVGVLTGKYLPTLQLAEQWVLDNPQYDIFYIGEV